MSERFERVRYIVATDFSACLASYPTKGEAIAYANAVRSAGFLTSLESASLRVETDRNAR